MKLIDRHAECGVLDGLLEAIHAGESRALVVSGEPGVGKTALLEYLSEHASGCHLARAAGVQSEMELPFAGLHQLCAPMLGNLPHLPLPQRDALRTAFGMSAGSAPDRFLVGLAVLSLLSDTAERQPLVCVVDDEQWLDRTSAQVLGFVARRLMAESVALIFAARVPSSELKGLPGLVVDPLAESDARALLDGVLTGPLDSRVRDRILAETQGNPLALLELPRGLTPQQLAGGFGRLGAVRLSRGIEESFRQRIEALPAQTRRLLLIAAAEPMGDPDLLSRAVARMGIDAEAAVPAVEANLVEFGSRVQFRRPSSARSSTGPRRRRKDAKCMLPWATPPIRKEIQIDARGIGPMPHLDPTRRSPRSWSGRQGVRVPEAACPPRPHSSSAQRADPRFRETHRARVGGGVDENQGRCVRRCPRSAGRRGVGGT